MEQYTRKIIAIIIYSKNCKYCELQLKKDNPKIALEEFQNMSVMNNETYILELDEMWADL